MIRWYVYILRSASLNRYYTGFSQFRFKRLRQHRGGQTSWTSRADDWQEVWSIEVSTSDQARTLELKIKKRGPKRFLADQSAS